MRRSIRFGAAALVLALGLAACGSDSDSESASGTGDSGDKLKVAFVYIGPTGDAGWTKRHDDGRKAMEEALGDEVETTVLENIPEGAESKSTFEDLARDGYGLIFATSFGYMDPMLEVAGEYPDVCFEHATGYKTADNMGTYFGAAEEARYLSGIAAGNATQNGKIGYVAAFPIPEVLRGINAFTLGVRSVKPEATVQVSWTSTWFGPDTERQAAETLLEAGADVLAMHQDSTATGLAAEDADAKWVGYNDDQSAAAPEAWLTGPKWDWGPYYTQTAQSVIDGTCPNDQYYGNMADGMVTLSSFGSSVTEETKSAIEAKQQEIIDGSFQIFAGPINNQAGEVVVPEGSTATLEELLGTDYLVEGVIGEIPES